MEEISIWDGPCADLVYEVPEGTQKFWLPIMQNEQELPIGHAVILDSMWLLSHPQIIKIEYHRIDETDWKGRAYFAMKLNE